MAKILTNIDVCNMALAYLGEQRISSLDEDTKEAELLTIHFEQTKRELLEARRWAAGRSRSRLTESTTPAWGYLRSFLLPEDMLRLLDVVEIGDTDPTDLPIPIRKFEVEDNLLLADQQYVGIVYIKDLTVAEFTPLMIKALASALAAKIAIGLGESRMTPELNAMADRDLKRAWSSVVKQTRSGENSDFLDRSQYENPQIIQRTLDY